MNDPWPKGPCLICGNGPAAHRMLDTMVDMIDAGDDLRQVWEDYGIVDIAMWNRLADFVKNWKPDE